MIKLRQVSKFYDPDVVALNRLSLHITPGEFVSIVGQSGTGKTTLIKLLTAEEKADEGQIIIGGWDISDIHKSDIPILRRQIGIIFQDFKLLPNKTVEENVSFALQVCGVGSKQINSLVDSMLKVVGLEGKHHRYPWQLSGGEKQRVSIARAMIHRPKILFADEPTGNLDVLNTKEIIDLLQKINQFGTTVVLVSHDREIVNSLKKRVITMEAGQVVNDQKVGRYIL
ncbi:MAG TPA: cell division ATP-binding protein FtsE [bacterium]|nr:cell division ATP-binding protein FtsE [bacterium]